MHTHTLVIRCDSVDQVVVQRWDTSALEGKVYESTPQGGIRARGRFARSGVFEYDLPDGTKRREWVAPEELFRPESYTLLCDAPITIHHPDGGEVKAGTYQRLTIGHVGGDVAPEGNEFLAGTVVIQDESAVRMALARSLTEFSAGYLCALEFTPGVVPDGYPDAGKPYDCIQRNRKYNHLAFVPPGLGRAGPSVSLRLDSKGNQVGPTSKGNTMELTPEEIAALKQLAAMAPKLTALLAAPAPVPAAPPVPPAAPTVDTTPAPAAPPAAPPKPPEEEKKVDSLTAEEQERIVNDSIEIRDQARGVLGDTYVFAGKSNRTVMLDVVKHVDSTLDLSKRSDDAVRAAFDVALPRFKEQQANKTAEHLSLRNLHTDSVDGDDSYEAALSKNMGGAYKAKTA